MDNCPPTTLFPRMIRRLSSDRAHPRQVAIRRPSHPQSLLNPKGWNLYYRILDLLPYLAKQGILSGHIKPEHFLIPSSPQGLLLATCWTGIQMEVSQVFWKWLPMSSRHVDMIVQDDLYMRIAGFSPSFAAPRKAVLQSSFEIPSEKSWNDRSQCITTIG